MRCLAPTPRRRSRKDFQSGEEIPAAVIRPVKASSNRGGFGKGLIAGRLNSMAFRSAQVVGLPGAERLAHLPGSARFQEQAVVKGRKVREAQKSGSHLPYGVASTAGGCCELVR